MSKRRISIEVEEADLGGFIIRWVTTDEDGSRGDQRTEIESDSEDVARRARGTIRDWVRAESPDPDPDP